MGLHQTAVIIGVGPGLGAALARRFACGGFKVGLVARRPDFINELARELSVCGVGSLAVVADVSQPHEVTSMVNRVRTELGPIGVLIFNASDSSGDGLLGTTPTAFEAAWRVGSLGAFVSAQATAPDMLAAGEGAMFFTGATSSVRGGGWLAFSSAKFALRGLVQSLARELWPKGIHIAHILVDGIISSTDSPADSATDPALEPEHMAEAYWQLAHQHRSAWTLELDLRPSAEQFFV